MTQPIVLAFVGGLASDLLVVLELRNTPRAQRADFEDPLFWIALLAWPLVGALFGYLYDEEGAHLGKMASFQIGLTGSLILQKLASAAPGKTRDLPPGA